MEDLPAAGAAAQVVLDWVLRENVFVHNAAPRSTIISAGRAARPNAPNAVTQ